MVWCWEWGCGDRNFSRKLLPFWFCIFPFCSYQRTYVIIVSRLSLKAGRRNPVALISLVKLSRKTCKLQQHVQCISVIRRSKRGQTKSMSLFSASYFVAYFYFFTRVSKQFQRGLAQELLHNLRTEFPKIVSLILIWLLTETFRLSYWMVSCQLRPSNLLSLTRDLRILRFKAS